MELLTLDSSFQPVDLIENYESLIWTERYSKYGDFQLTTTDIATFVNALPLETYVTLRESTVPMCVEIYKIEKRKNQTPLLTITGRSFETCLERRAAVKEMGVDGSPPRPAWQETAKKESDAAFQAMRIVLGDGDRGVVGLEATSGVGGALSGTPAVSLLDAIPEINLIVPADYDEGDAVDTDYEIKAADLYSTVMGLLNVNHRGLKSVRPVLGGNQVGIEIYNGADLTSEVVFDARFDQFDNAKYLLSQLGSTNVGYVYGPDGGTIVLKTAAAEPSGLARRVLLVDAPSDPIDTPELRTSRGLVELYKYNQTALFDGEISEQIAAGFNDTYFLGDIIKLVGEYGIYETVRVSEFIRSHDRTGQKSYPTFEVVV